GLGFVGWGCSGPAVVEVCGAPNDWSGAISFGLVTSPNCRLAENGFDSRWSGGKRKSRADQAEMLTERA
uniref:hypothetical protein n=1 Tax=Streptomyces sp. IBSBF 2806 TaxID=2903529 RepID=UPI002FDC4008